MSWMMGGMNGQMGMGMMIGGMMSVYAIFSIIGLSSGALVILGAVMLYSRPFEKDLWGGVIIAFSILGILGGMGGFMIGLVGAVMLYSRPFEKDLWGGVIIAFSILGILGGMGGFMIGLVLGIVGGVLALAWNPTPNTALSTPAILSS